MMIFDGNVLMFVQRPISALLLGVAALLLIGLSMPSIMTRRKKIFVED